MLLRLISLLLLPLWYLHGWRHGKTYQLPNYLAMRRCQSLPAVSGTVTWFHAASVGEIEAITPLVEVYLRRGDKVLLTSFTASGYLTIRKNFGTEITATTIPIDSAACCGRFLQHFSVNKAVFMETELWPLMLSALSKRSIPTILVNARLTSKSTGNRLIRHLLQKPVSQLTSILCRYDDDRLNFLKLSATQQSITVIGNLKSAGHEPAPMPRLVSQPYLLLASSHEPEEADILRCRPRGECPLIVMVPRHPARSDSLQRLLREMQLRYAVRSQGDIVDENTEVYLADTLGELQQFMQHTLLVIMGGSFEGSGGHNLLEPARLGCAIITGPSDDNIKDDIERLVPGSGILQVTSVAEAWQAANRLLSDPDIAAQLGDHARQQALQSDSVLERYVDAIDRVTIADSDQA